MSASLEQIITAMIRDAPPGSPATLIKDIKSILNNSNSKSLISKILEEHYLNEDFKLIKLKENEFGIISKYNKSGIKFIDPNTNLEFDYDFDTLKVIDVESSSAGSGFTIDDETKSLSSSIESYVEEHFPTLYKSLVIPDLDNSDIIYIIIIDENLNDSNFYNGKWQSFYKFNRATNTLEGEITIKIHYYEDGNVILKTGKKINSISISIKDVSSKIKEIEDEFEFSVVNKFTRLNEDLFKNLRRQLPINRTKVQWGKAIGNYKLGQDVAGGRH